MPSPLTTPDLRFEVSATEWFDTLGRLADLEDDLEYLYERLNELEG